jgi:hypothetical protein
MKNLIISLLPVKAYLTLKWLDYKKQCPEAFAESQQLRTHETNEWGSYKPFDDKRAIFVHVPKCAGISVNRSLFGNLAGGHTTLEQYLTVFEPKHILNYFKFTIVRNPWDRVVSAYFFLQQGGFNKWDKQFYDDELAKYDSFDAFVSEWLTVPENLTKHHHFRMQSDYILDKYNKVTLDFIGYLENIDQDFDYISKKIGVRTPLPKSNASSRSSYTHYYNETTKEIIAQTYKTDIELLGYNFDNSSLLEVIQRRNRL